MEGRQSDRRTIYIGQLPPKVTKEMLHEACLPFGEIISIDIPVDARTPRGLSGASKGFAFIEFEETEDAHHAIDNLNGGQFYGKTIKVSYARIGQRQQAMAAHIQSRRAIWAQDDYLKDRLAANHPTEDVGAAAAPMVDA